MDKAEKKHLLVGIERHKRVKILASELGVTIDEAIDYLLKQVGK